MNTFENYGNEEDVRGVLDNLIEITRDGQEGYRLAAESASDPGLKQAFAERCEERARFVRSLQDLQSRYGGDVEENGSMTGSLHRAWMQIKAAVARKEDQALLEEAERGEDAAMGAYREALQHLPPLPEDAALMVQEQAIQVKQDHDYIRDLRDSGRFAVV